MMILRNSTYSIDSSEYENWLDWFENTLIQQVLLTGLIFDYKVLKMMDEPDNTSSTVAIQYYFADATDFDTYNKNFEPIHKKMMNDVFKGKFAGFTTFLKVLKY